MAACGSEPAFSTPPAAALFLLSLPGPVQVSSLFLRSMIGAALFVITVVAARHISRDRIDWWTSSVTPKFITAESDGAVIDSADPGLGEKMRRRMNSTGYCVVRGALSGGEVAEALSLMLDYLEAARVVVKEDVWPECVEGGILPYYGAGQSKCAWYARSRPGVLRAFEGFWGTEDLVTSFDGLLAWKEGTVTEKGWFHVDQNPRNKPGFCCVQGVLNLIDSSEGTGGNVLIRGSHNQFPHHYTNGEWYNRRMDELGGDDWLELRGDDELLKRASKSGDVIMLGLKAGDLLIWDSRVAHCSYPGDGGGRSVMGLIRAAALVTMMPRLQVSKEVSDVRREAVRAGQTGTHWPNKMATLGSERQEEVSKEGERVRRMRERGALMDLEGLTKDMIRLV